MSSSSALQSLSGALGKLNLGSRSVCSNCRLVQQFSCQPRQQIWPVLRQPHFFGQVQTRNASHAASGVANGPKNRPGRRLGAKRGAGEYVTPNTIIFRQRGSNWHPGENAGIGRDHTIVARQPGYVRYYRDPARHPDRKYIGIVYNSEDKLPYPPNTPRRRRLGLIAVPMRDDATTAAEAGSSVVVGTGHNEADGRVGELVSNKNWPWESYSDVFPVTGKDGTTKNLKLRADGSYRLTNREIGRSAERANIKVAPYVKDRFLAWRKANARKARNALAKSAGKKKGKKSRK